MMPLAPGLFSTTTLTPRISRSSSAAVRNVMSVAPPAANALMMRIG
jgi:hypothetical protein